MLGLLNLFGVCASRATSCYFLTEFCATNDHPNPMNHIDWGTPIPGARAKKHLLVKPICHGTGAFCRFHSHRGFSPVIGKWRQT